MLKRICLLALLVGCILLSCRAVASERLELKGQRIVFLGDSITDGNSYPLMVRQALKEAGKDLPVLINAGIGGDTAAGMIKRLERDVFVHRPTLVSISVGINDVLRKVETRDYVTTVGAIAEQIRSKNIPLLILTTSVLGKKHEAADKRLEEFNAALREIAIKTGARLGDVNQRMNAARAAGETVLEEDEVHPNYAGQRLMARTVLDALGCESVPLPAKFEVELIPDIVRKWQIVPVPDKTPPLMAETLAKLAPDGKWKTLRLPEKETLEHWWQDQERQRGFAMSLDKLAGKASTYYGVATFGQPKARSAFINTGGQLKSVWLNGRNVYKASAEWTGWHAGRERIPVELPAGTNTLVIETGSQFFLSISETNDW
ncbi:MAG TPA: SGNH/GDSL hydrolase family protein [Planctomycetota bacterium]|nr:SGNH/GDSL hydrolase family protein [Planctomycetota bacterium]